MIKKKEKKNLALALSDCHFDNVDEYSLYDHDKIIISF